MRYRTAHRIISHCESAVDKSLPCEKKLVLVPPVLLPAKKVLELGLVEVVLAVLGSSSRSQRMACHHGRRLMAAMTTRELLPGI